MLTLTLAACVTTIAETAPIDTEAADTDVLDTDVDTADNDDDADDLGLCAVTVDCERSISTLKRACALTFTDVAGEPEWAGTADVWLRGRSSATSPKPQYGIELHDEAGEDASADLFAMGGDADWVLNGLYYDRLLVRNTLGFDLFTSFTAGNYAPESRFCELWLDGEPRGVYGLYERIKRDDDRLALADSDAGDVFVAKLVESDRDWPNPAGYGGWKLVSPNDPTDDAYDAIGAALDAWEQAALKGDVSDTTGVFAFVDLDSAVDFVILQEVLKNHDGYFLSIYVAKDAGQKIRFVPWDLDLALGQPNYNDNPNPASWLSYRPALIDVMADSPVFRARLAARWAELRAGPLAEEALNARIDGYQATLGDAIDRNFEVWPIEEIDFYGFLTPMASYEDEDAHVRAFLHDRVAWMDGAITTWGG